MNRQLQADQAESQSESSIEAKALATLRARNERLASLLGCVVETITADMEGQVMSPQLKEDIAMANATLDEYEKYPL